MDLSERTDTATARHPWEQARAAFLLDILDEAGVLAAGGSVLDVGSGDGWLAQQLVARSSCAVTCWDPHFADDDVARLRSPRLLPVREPPRGPFDTALMLDVMEHVDDDDAFVDDVLARVRPGGRVLVSVPAWPRLFSSHDRALAHVRRYTPAACRRVLRRAGLHIDRSGGFFHGLIAPRAAAVVVERLRGTPSTASTAGIGGWSHGPLLTGAITAALRAELRVSKAAAAAGVDVPGLSFFALCTLVELR
ncbi:MAG: methyltransferase domain-containing protein [Deltaproteobacteria bacterium]|nr:methyltransferase domain-containing protein [Deltaproteobacteria bacterium]